MTIDDPNPYAAPNTEPIETLAPWSRWRLIPAALFFLLGVASLAFGLFAIAAMVYIFFAQGRAGTIGIMIAGCSLYVGVGLAWMLAGWLYWRRRYKYALIATAIGIAIPAVLFSLLGI